MVQSQLELHGPYLKTKHNGRLCCSAVELALALQPWAELAVSVSSLLSHGSRIELRLGSSAASDFIPELLVSQRKLVGSGHYSSSASSPSLLV